MPKKSLPWGNVISSYHIRIMMSSFDGASVLYRCRWSSTWKPATLTMCSLCCCWPQIRESTCSRLGAQSLSEHRAIHKPCHVPPLRLLHSVR